MGIELNHTIVHARDREASAQFLAEILGIQPGAPTGPFIPITLSNGVTLDYMQSDRGRPQHYAFLVDDDVFDAALERLRGKGIELWADPGRTQPGINHAFGGRGFYFAHPDDHNMKLLTRV
ncbi:MAG: VOC family protein [Streptomyces sp.]|jgi:catechol 2,3-dioxygenase-like lactoylglutathione lyase family enzyme|nr:VOC family protein [Streptomyces sp.]